MTDADVAGFGGVGGDFDLHTDEELAKRNIFTCGLCTEFYALENRWSIDEARYL
jgi:hypothetical protein